MENIDSLEKRTSDWRGCNFCWYRYCW